MKSFLSAMGLAAALVLGGCAKQPESIPATSDARAGKATIIDVRTAEEFSEEHLAGALNVPVDDIETGIAKVASDKSQPIVVHCAAGGRSARAKRKLEKMGYTNVTDWGSLENAKAMAVRAENGNGNANAPR